MFDLDKYIEYLYVIGELDNEEEDEEELEEENKEENPDDTFNYFRRKGL